MSWKPELTPKVKLIPWYLMSLLLLGVNSSFIYIVLQHILAYTKDPEMTATHIMLLVMCTCGTTFASASILTYPLQKDGIMFVLGNLKAIKNTLRADGMT